MLPLFGGGFSFQGAAGKSESGDADGSQSGQSSFASQYNAQFLVGGSGSQTASQTASQSQTPTNSLAQGQGLQNNMPLYIALGALGFISIFALIRK